MRAARYARGRAVLHVAQVRVRNRPGARSGARVSRRWRVARRQRRRGWRDRRGSVALPRRVWITDAMVKVQPSAAPGDLHWADLHRGAPPGLARGAPRYHAAVGRERHARPDAGCADPQRRSARLLLRVGHLVSEGCTPNGSAGASLPSAEWMSLPTVYALAPTADAAAAASAPVCTGNAERSAPLATTTCRLTRTTGGQRPGGHDQWVGPIVPWTPTFGVPVPSPPIGTTT